MSKVLALDYGLKRVGVAISDDDQRWAFARQAMENSSPEKLADSISVFVHEEDVEVVVVGHPLSQKGTPTEMTEHVERFVEILKAKLQIPVEVMDERMTTTEANRVMEMSGRNASQKKADRDAIAAATILQSYLDRRAV